MDIIKFYERGHNSNQLVVQWNLGNTCNYSCEYCPNILHNGTRQWVELPLIENTLIKIKNYFPEKKLRIEFLGGEITLYRDFIGLMEFCKEHSINNMIFTNASRTFRHWEEVIPLLDEVRLTFHPHNADKLHFEKIINLCIKNNIRTHVHIAMVEPLFEELVSYALYIVDKFPETNISLTLMMDKEHRKHFNGYFYDYSQEQLNIVKEFSFTNEIYVAEYQDGSLQNFNMNQIKDLKINHFKGFTCGILKEIITIDYLGKASTSLCRHKPVINIYTESIDKLLNTHVCRKEICENPSDIRIFKIKEIK
jgi:organic radical activating enzyme